MRDPFHYRAKYRGKHKAKYTDKYADYSIYNLDIVYLKKLPYFFTIDLTMITIFS